MQLQKKIFEGSEEIPENVYSETYKKISEAIDAGYGVDYKTDDIKMVFQLKNNAAVFSAFKANHFAGAMRSLLVDENGIKRTYGAFRKVANEVNTKYNQLWLMAEYNLATRQARAAANWQTFEAKKDIYPNLEYMPSRSPNQRDSHKKFYGIVLPIEHPFWDTALPPNGWGCKCWVKQTKGDITPGEVEAPEKINGIDGNAGKSGKIFDASHAYISSLSAKDKDAVKKEFYNLRSNNVEIILHKVDKNYIKIPIDADPGDLSHNISFGEAIVKKYKSDLSINSHINGSKNNPEFTFLKVIGDAVKADSDNLRSTITNGFSSKVGKKGQMRDLKKCWIGFDFKGKLTDENIIQTMNQFIPKFEHYQNVEFVIFKNNEKIYKIENQKKFDKEEFIKKTKAELL